MQLCMQLLFLKSLPLSGRTFLLREAKREITKVPPPLVKMAEILSEYIRLILANVELIKWERKRKQ